MCHAAGASSSKWCTITPGLVTVQARPIASPVPQVPRLPRKLKVDVTTCHACHTKDRGVTADHSRPSASPEPTQVHKCHATQSEGRCHQLPPLPYKVTVDVTKRLPQPSAASATPATQRSMSPSATPVTVDVNTKDRSVTADQPRPSSQAPKPPCTPPHPHMHTHTHPHPLPQPHRHTHTQRHRTRTRTHAHARAHAHTHIWCEPAQSKCISALHKSHLIRKFTRKMPGPRVSPERGHTVHTLCEPAWKFHMSHFTRKFKGKFPRPRVSTLIKHRPLLIPSEPFSVDRN